MNRFVRRNWRYLIVLVLAVLWIGGAIFSVNIGNVSEVQEQQKEQALIEKESLVNQSTKKVVPKVKQTTGGFVEDKPTAGVVSDTKKVSPVVSGDIIDYKEEDVSGNKGDITVSKRQVSVGQVSSQDKYKTDPVPKGKPLPVDRENQVVDVEDVFYVYLSIDCETILNNKENLRKGLDKYVGDGTILEKTKVVCYRGESVWDVLSRECKARGINLESSSSSTYGSAYVEGINNLYEFDCGELSGWCYLVDGWHPNYGCSRYILEEGEVIQWRYTCDLGADLGITGLNR